MKRTPILFCLLFLLSTAGADKLNYNQVQLTAEAKGEVPNDTLVAVLYSRHEGHDPAELANNVNRDIGWAVKMAKQTPEIQTQTLSYRTNPKYDKGHLIGWRAEQSVQVKSKDIPGISKLIGNLQSKLAVQSVSYLVSDEVRKKAEEKLIKEALQNFQQRAAMITRSLGRKDYRLVHINVNSKKVPTPRPYMRSMAMEAKAAAPTFETGSQDLSLTVSGTVEISGE